MALTVSLDEIIAQGSPLLRIKPHWQRVRLGDIGSVLNGFAFKSALFSRDDGVPLIRIRDVGSDASDTFYKGEFDERYVVNAGDFLVGMDGDFNSARWRGPKSLLNQRVCKVDVDPERYFPRFLDFVLPGYLKAINEATSSVTVKHLSSRTIEDIPLPLPSMEEQKAIADELDKQFSRLDEAVANLQRVKANLKRYKAAVLKAAVEGRLVETEAELARREGRSYETGEQLLRRILEERQAKWTGKGKYKAPIPPVTTALSDLPEGWAWGSYSQLGEVTTGFTPPTGDATNFGGATPFFKPTDLDAGDNVRIAREYLTEAGLQKGRKLPAGSVLVTCIGATIGKAGLAAVDCATNQQINSVSPVAGCVDSRYLFWWTIAPKAQEQIVDNASATTLPILNKSKFAALPVALPPMAEQTRIVAEVDSRLSIIREVEAEVDANLKRAQALRQASLSRMFGGAHA